jgi:molybdopterin converting factor small subunit
MSVTIKVPSQLRTLTGGEAEVQATGQTVREIVADLDGHHPGLGERLLDESGSLRRFLNVYVNDEDVRFLDGIDTEVPAGSKVSIIPAVAGGA